jgi:hypothetical protein
VLTQIMTECTAPQEWVEQLLPLVVEHGVSAFILATDDPTTIERYAQEVAPTLREAVAAERGPTRIFG